MRNFPRHRAEFLIYFGFVISSLHKEKRKEYVSRELVLFVDTGDWCYMCNDEDKGRGPQRQTHIDV